LPNLASAHEQGFADFEAPTWFAVFLPRGASEPIIRSPVEITPTGVRDAVDQLGDRSARQGDIGRDGRGRPSGRLHASVFLRTSAASAAGPVAATDSELDAVGNTGGLLGVRV